MHEQIFNLARLLAALIAEGDLSLAMLKVVDFTQLSPQANMFFTCLLETLFALPALRLTDILSDAVKGKDGLLVRDALVVYLYVHFGAKGKLRGESGPYPHATALQRMVDALEQAF